MASGSVLLIDADRPTLDALTVAFESRGVAVHVAADGAAGVQLAYRLQPTAIVLAVELPTISGYSVCKKLKRTSQTESIPILLTSSTSTDETFEQHRRLRTRADFYLHKPVDGEQVWAQLQHLFGTEDGLEAAEDFMEGFDLDGAFDQILDAEGLDSVISGSWDSGSADPSGTGDSGSVPAVASGSTPVAGAAILRRTGEYGSASSSSNQSINRPAPMSRILRDPRGRSPEGRRGAEDVERHPAGAPLPPQAAVFRRRNDPQSETAPSPPVEGRPSRLDEIELFPELTDPDSAEDRQTKDVPPVPSPSEPLQSSTALDPVQATGTVMEIRQTSEKLSAIKRSEDGDSLRLEVNILIEQIEQQHAIHKQLQRALDTARSENEEAQRRHTAQAQQMARLTARTQELQSTLDARNTEQEMLHTELARLQRVVLEREHALAEREQALQQRDEEATRLRSRIAGLEAEAQRNAEAREASDELRSSLQRIQSLHDELEARARAWSEERETMTGIQLRLSQQVALLEEEAERSQHELQTALEALETTQAERDALREQVAEWESRYGEQDEITLALQTQIDGATDRLAELTRELDASRSRQQALTQEMSRVRDDLERTRQHRARLDAMLVETGAHYRAQFEQLQTAFEALSGAHTVALDNLEASQSHASLVEERLFTATEVLGRIGALVTQITGAMGDHDEDLSLPDSPMLADVPAVQPPIVSLPEPWTPGQWTDWEPTETPAPPEPAGQDELEPGVEELATEAEAPGEEPEPQAAEAPPEAPEPEMAAEELPGFELNPSEDGEVISLADVLEDDHGDQGPPPPPIEAPLDEDSDELLDVVVDSVVPEDFDEEDAAQLEAVELEPATPQESTATMHAPGMKIADLDDEAPVGDLADLDELVGVAPTSHEEGGISHFHIPPPDEGDGEAIVLAMDEMGGEGYGALEDLAGMSDDGLMLLDPAEGGEEIELLIDPVAGTPAPQAPTPSDSEMELFAFDEAPPHDPSEEGDEPALEGPAATRTPPSQTS